jgi:hypothetical protein
MVAAVVISSAVFLAVNLTCRRLDIMLLEVEIALEAKITRKEERETNQMEDALASAFYDKAPRVDVAVRAV